MNVDNYEESKKNTKRYKKILKLFKNIYSHNSFKPFQYEIINRIINRENICCIMPTGYGKTSCCVIPALYLERPAIIISPLISLMNDQQIRLEKLNISSICYNSKTKKKSSVKDDIINNNYQIIYVTPESLEQIEETLKELNENVGISLFAIDEAHCISSFGCDFRPYYRELHKLKVWFPDIPILAVTATATQPVVADIKKVLGILEAKTIMSSFDRPNIFINVEQKPNDSELEREFKKIITNHKDETIIIYCLTKKDTEKIYEILKNSCECDIYHAGLNDETRKQVHENFINGSVKCVIATLAFGMGIDKSDVRVVIHYGAPKNIENYVQEIGRAGRDGKQSYCYLFYSIKDFIINRRFISDISNEQHRFNSSRLLLAMEKYVNHTKCLRRYILDYFNSPEIIKDNCESCSNCVKKKNNVNKENQTRNVSIETLFLLSCLKETNYIFGNSTIIGILRGSKNKKIPEKYKNIDSYGKGKNHDINWWKDLINQLLENEFLKEKMVETGTFAYKTLINSKMAEKWFEQYKYVLDLEGINDINQCFDKKIKIK